MAERIEPNIASAHTIDPGERREVAQTLAGDAIALREEAREVADAQAQVARTIEAQHGTVEDAIARDCEMMRLELEALQRPSTEIRTAEESSAVSEAIDELKACLLRNCESPR